MGNGQKTLHKIRELAEVALNILERSGGARWLLGHVDLFSLERRVGLRVPKVNRLAG
jgi:hypothetical protein